MVVTKGFGKVYHITTYTIFDIKIIYYYITALYKIYDQLYIHYIYYNYIYRHNILICKHRLNSRESHPSPGFENRFTKDLPFSE